MSDSVSQRRPNEQTGHAYYCDCGDCLGDGNESQWHRRGVAHDCIDGSWWPGFGVYAATADSGAR